MEIEEMMAIQAIQEERHEQYWDDLSGRKLIPELVKKARLEELGEIAKHRVYEKVAIEGCWKNTGQAPIGSRWVDVNQGDDENPDYRSRLVAQELNTQKTRGSVCGRPANRGKKDLTVACGGRGNRIPAGTQIKRTKA